MPRLGEICERGSDLYTIDHPLRLGGVEFGTRTTLVKLTSGGLFVHAPGPLAGGLKASIDALGPVEALVAPNLFHHFYIAENVAAWPDAALHMAPGLPEKIKGLPSGGLLGTAPSPTWAGQLEQIAVDGMPRMSEVAFYHPKTRTLLLTDLVFNFDDSASFIPRTILKLMGAFDHFGPSRLARSFMKDKVALRAFIDRILEWDIERILLAHGDIVEQDAHRRLALAYEEVLGG